MTRRIDFCPRCGKLKIVPTLIENGEYKYICYCEKSEKLSDGTIKGGRTTMWSVPMRVKSDIMFLIDETVSWMLWSDAERIQAYVIREAINNNYITCKEMVDHFRAQLEKGLK